MVTPPVAPTPDDFSARADELVAAGRTLDQRGWVPATSGNLSARLTDGSVAITASGRHKGRLLPADILRVDNQGHSLDGRRPSAETHLHVQIYGLMPAAGVVLHPHSPKATAISRLAGDLIELTGYELLKALPGISSHEARVPIPVLPNDQDIPRLAVAVGQALARHPTAPAYLIAGHGLYTWGGTVEDALRHVEALEFLFDQLLILSPGKTHEPFAD